MASSAQDDVGNDENGKSTSKTAVWHDIEVISLLGGLADKKSTHMSGNGFKPQVWPFIVKKVEEVNPNANPKKDKQKCMNKLNYLKKIFDRYVFVQKFSGSGWDDEAKHATNTKEYVEDFVKTYGDDYSRCFTTACPYWAELDALYSGMTNKATGEHVQHLGPKKHRKSRKSMQATPSTSSSTPSNTPSNIRAPLGSISTNADSLTDSQLTSQNDGEEGRGAFDDELDVDAPTPSHKGPKKRERAPTDDDTSDAENMGRKPLKHQRSDSGGIARRNAEAGTQISRALDNLSSVMAQPLVTSEDLSYVNEVVNILKDPTLLPADPRGKLYRTVSAALSRDAALARVFILEEDRTRRIGILEGILEDAGLLDP